MCFDDNKHTIRCKCSKQVIKCASIIRKTLQGLLAQELVNMSHNVWNDMYNQTSQGSW